MGLKSLIFSKNGVFLNSLKRFALSGLLVPPQELLVVKIPAAASATQPGRSPLIPIQGAADAKSELYSLTGKEGVVNQGVGKITSTGGDVNIVGTGTKFLTQLQVGDNISTTAGTAVIATVTSDTAATTVVALAASALLDYFFSTTIVATISPKLFVTIQDVAFRRYLMNRDVPVYHVFGDNQQPLFLIESLLLETDQTLLFQFLNYATGGRASFAPISEARKWQYEALKYDKVNQYIAGLLDRKQFIQPYWLTIDRGVSAIAAANNSQTIEFFTATGDITLFLFNAYGNAFNAAGSDVSDNILVTLSDAKTQRNICTNIPLSCFTGSAPKPFRFSSPWIIEPQTRIQANFTNISLAAADIYMTFHGAAIYTGSSWHGSTLTSKRLKEEGERMNRAMSTPQIRPASPQGEA